MVGQVVVAEVAVVVEAVAGVALAWVGVVELELGVSVGQVVGFVVVVGSVDVVDKLLVRLVLEYPDIDLVVEFQDKYLLLLVEIHQQGIVAVVLADPIHLLLADPIEVSFELADPIVLAFELPIVTELVVSIAAALVVPIAAALVDPIVVVLVVSIVLLVESVPMRFVPMQLV